MYSQHSVLSRNPTPSIYPSRKESLKKFEEKTLIEEKEDGEEIEEQDIEETEEFIYPPEKNTRDESNMEQICERRKQSITNYTIIPEKQGVGIQPEEGFVIDIKGMAIVNNLFRRTLYTSTNNNGNGMQISVMNLQPNEDIGIEIHTTADQEIRVEQGIGLAKVGNYDFEVKENALIIIPKGIVHNITNTSNTFPLKLSTIYSRPVHIPGYSQITKPRA